MNRWFLCLVLILSTLPCYADNLCVLILEMGLSGEQVRVDASSAWESGIMDAFFNEGVIVSSAPMARIAPASRGSEFPVDPSWGLKEAREGGADMVVIVVLDYNGLSIDKDGLMLSTHSRICPARAYWEIKSLNPEKVLAKGITGELKPTATYKEDMANAALIAKLLISGMKER